MNLKTALPSPSLGFAPNTKDVPRGGTFRRSNPPLSPQRMEILMLYIEFIHFWLK